MPGRAPEAWVPQEATLDDVELVAMRVPDKPREGKQCLQLMGRQRQPKGKDAKQFPPIQSLERTFLAINSPAVRLPPGSLVRISAWVRLRGGLNATEDGALFYDSAGGEPLAIRLNTSTGGWKKYTLYRQVPPSGSLYVTLAITGIGLACFDDVRIEPLTPSTAQGPSSGWRAGAEERRP